MEVPTTAAYVICVSVAGPALIDRGLEPILVHLFVFWYALLSDHHTTRVWWGLHSSRDGRRKLVKGRCIRYGYWYWALHYSGWHGHPSGDC